jgi:hypothetical protein
MGWHTILLTHKWPDQLRRRGAAVKILAATAWKGEMAATSMRFSAM